MFSYWAKAIGAVLVTIGTAIVGFLTDDVMSPEEWALVVGIAAGAVGVAIVPNFPPGSGIQGALKAVVMATTAGSAALALVISGGLTTAEVWEVIIASLAALGVVTLKGNVGDFRATGHLESPR